MPHTIEQLALRLGQQLKKRSWKLVTAESCTGGGLAYAITQVAGCSTWFEQGLVPYSNTSKEKLLGVNALTLTTFGSVSEQTARAMAEGALQRSQAQISLAITGIAGPEGGSADQPVGTVWIACATILTVTQTRHCLFTGERTAIREQSIETALRVLLSA